MSGLSDGVDWHITEIGSALTQADRTWEYLMKFLQAFTQFLHDEDGVTAIEYGLIAALIAVVIIAATTAIGTNLTAIFTCISGKLGDASYTCA